MTAPAPLRVLQVEDSANDAAIVIRLLERAGYEVTSQRVDTEQGLRDSLAAQPWDVIIADYQMPQFDAPTALQVLREAGLDVPFIVVSGAIGEDLAVALMRGGASDYLLKHNLVRLVPAVAREVAEARNRAARQTQERTLNAQLARAELEWRLTYDALELPIVLVGLSGKIIRMNEAARVLLRPDTGSEGPSSARFPWAQALVLIERCATHTERAAAQLKDVASGRIWECTASHFQVPGSTEAHVIFVAQEVTSLIRLQNELGRSELLAALGHLVGGVAHEVRNPLFGITATMDALEAAHHAKPELADITRYTSVMRREIERMKSLMDELLDYGKPESLNLRGMSPEVVCRDAMQACAAAASAGRVSVRLAPVEDADLRVFVDSDRLTLAVGNLLRNAIQLSAPGTEVTLSMRQQVDAGGSWVDIVVADQGPGIPPEHLGRLFEPFFTTRRGGTGLGLAIVSRVVNQHRGRVWAENGASRGAVFTVRLPSAGDDV